MVGGQPCGLLFTELEHARCCSYKNRTSKFCYGTYRVIRNGAKNPQLPVSEFKDSIPALTLSSPEEKTLKII